MRENCEISGMWEISIKNAGEKGTEQGNGKHRNHGDPAVLLGVRFLREAGFIERHFYFKLRSAILLAHVKVCISPVLIAFRFHERHDPRHHLGSARGVFALPHLP